MANGKGIRVTGVDTVVKALASYRSRLTGEMWDLLKQGGRKVRDEARKNAPVDEGNLERALYTETDRKNNRVLVGVDEEKVVPDRPDKTVGDYATRMHEGDYKLGPKSRAKASRLGRQVGPKYLDRALRTITRDLRPKFMELVKRETAKADSAIDGKGLKK